MQYGTSALYLFETTISMNSGIARGGYYTVICQVPVPCINVSHIDTL